jgi:hypothetical protein
VDEPNLSDTAQVHVTAKDVQLKEMELATKAQAAVQAQAQTGLNAVHSHQQNELATQMAANKTRESAAKANLAEKKLRQSDFKKPKPKAGK